MCLASEVALDPSRPEHPGVGVARYVRLPEEPAVAGAAVTVLDAYQGKGIGTILLVLLAGSGLEHGIGCFRDYVLAENVPMVRPWRDRHPRRVAACASTCRSPPDPTSSPTRRRGGCSSRWPSGSSGRSACATPAHAAHQPARAGIRPGPNRKEVAR